MTHFLIITVIILLVFSPILAEVILDHIFKTTDQEIDDRKERRAWKALDR